MAAGFLDPHDVAGLRAILVGGPDIELAAELAVGRCHHTEAIAPCRFLVEPQELFRAVAETPDDACLVGRLASAFQGRENAIADGGSGAATTAMRIDLDTRSR